MIFLLRTINTLKRLRDNKSFWNGMLFSVFSFINKGFSFLLVLFMANYIPPAEYGYLSLFMTVVMVIGYFMALSTEGYLGVSYFKKGRYGLIQTTSGVLVISMIMLILLVLLINLFDVFLASLIQLNSNSLYLAVVICFFAVLSSIFLDLFRLKEKVIIYGVISCSNAFLNFLTTIILIKYIHCGWMGRVYSQLGCCVVFGFVAIFYFIHKGYIIIPNKKYCKQMLLWSLPIIPHLATSFIRQGCDRFIINSYHTITDVGLFSFALNLANIVVMIGVGFNQSNSVEIFKVLGDENISNEEKRQRLFLQRKQYKKIYCIFTICIMSLGYFIFPLLLPKYANSMNYFLLLTIWGLLQCMYLLYTNYLFYYNKTKCIMNVTFLTSLLHLVLSLFLTRYDLYFTCLIYIISQFVIFFIIKMKATKILQKNLTL